MSQCPHCGAEAAAGARYCPACGKELASATTVPSREPTQSREKKAGSCGVVAVVAAFVAVIGIAILGILAAILIPNFLDALEKARQKRSMADLDAVGFAVMAYYLDEEELPEAGSMKELAGYLEPHYLESVPLVDGWKNEIQYVCWRTGSSFGGCDSFALVSAGADGVLEHSDPRQYDEEVFERTDYDRDIVFVDDAFVQYPARAVR